MLDTKAKELTMAEMQDIVNTGAKMAEAVETNLDRAHAGTLKMVKVITDGRGAAMVGALEAGELTNEARAIAGDIAEALKRFFLLHRRLTDIATKHGVDVPMPRDGGGGR